MASALAVQAISTCTGKSVCNDINVKSMRVARARSCSSGQNYYCVWKYFILKSKVSSPLTLLTVCVKKYHINLKNTPVLYPEYHPLASSRVGLRAADRLV